MKDISIIGVGITPVGEHWGDSLREIGQGAVELALQDAGLTLSDIDALVVGNALGTMFNRQSHIAALIADYAGLRGIEAAHIEAADASGGMALRHGMLMVAAGAAKTVLVLGVEKVTDVVGAARNAALAT